MEVTTRVATTLRTDDDLVRGVQRRDPAAPAAIGGPRALGVQAGQPRGVARRRGRVERGQQVLFERREVDAQGASS